VATQENSAMNEAAPSTANQTLRRRPTQRIGRGSISTAAAAEPMRESPVRYFTPEDCRLPERTQIAPVDSA
jgi:hypothetical protein